MTRSAEWYFDFISPFSYLQFKTLDRLPNSVTLQFVPVLFAGLLNHWGNKGPAEIPSKRREMYQYCQWYAERHSIAFQTPSIHPFNPLNALRLAIVLGSTYTIIDTIFRHIWENGGELETEKNLSEFLACLNVDPEHTLNLINSQSIKKTLHKNTERAISAGVYGVPTFSLDDKLFWGFDRTDMLLDYLDKPTMFETREMKRRSKLPQGVKRLTPKDD